MPMERRGRVIRVIPTLVNRQREEPTGCDGERQLSMDGTSRVSREAQARICERLGLRSPGATRPRGATPRGYSTCATSTANSRKAEEVRNCLTDEGRPLGTGLQEQVPNHLRRLWAKAMVVNAEGKGLE